MYYSGGNKAAAVAAESSSFQAVIDVADVVVVVVDVLGTSWIGTHSLTHIHAHRRQYMPQTSATDYKVHLDRG